MKSIATKGLLNRLKASWACAAVLGCGPNPPDPPQSPCAKFAPGDLVITEFMADPSGSDTGKQYIEVYNATDHTVDLSGLALVQSMADGSRLNATLLRHAPIPTHAYYVLGDAGDNTQARPAYLSYGYGSDLGALRHASGKLGLYCTAAPIAEVAYAQVTEGRARELDGTRVPRAADALAPANWCDATDPLDSLAPAGQNYGSPGLPNLPCERHQLGSTDSGLGTSQTGDFVTKPATKLDAGDSSDRCFDAAIGAPRAIQRPAQGQLLLTEVMPAPSTNNNGPGEWFEVLATGDVDLNGLVLENEGTGSTTLTSETCLSTKSGEWLLFSRSSDTAQNGGLPSATALFDFSLADTASDAYPERAVALRSNGSLIDRFTWYRSTKGSAWQRAADTLTHGAAPEWCPAAADSSYGTGDHGTPRAANVACQQALGVGGSTSASIFAGGGTSSTVGKPITSGGRAQSAAGGTISYTPFGGASNTAGSGGAAITRTEETAAGGIRLGIDAGGGQLAVGGAGDPGATTDANVGGHCIELDGSERALVAPRAGELVITEVMSAPSSNNNAGAEWFEVLVNADLDLNGVEFANEGSGLMRVSGEACLRAHAGDRLVFARSTDFEQNGGLPLVTETFSFTLADSASESHPERMLLARHNGVILGQVTWVKSIKGASWQLSTSATPPSDGGIPSLDASAASSELWCVTPTNVTFGRGDRGTPGEANTTCE